MSGIYGNSKEDRYFESMLDRYTDEQSTEDYCCCDKAIWQDDNGEILISWDDYEVELLCDSYDVDSDLYRCSSCDLLIDKDELSHLKL